MFVLGLLPVNSVDCERSFVLLCVMILVFVYLVVVMFPVWVCFVVIVLRLRLVFWVRLLYFNLVWFLVWFGVVFAYWLWIVAACIWVPCLLVWFVCLVGFGLRIWFASRFVCWRFVCGVWGWVAASVAGGLCGGCFVVVFLRWLAGLFWWLISRFRLNCGGRVVFVFGFCALPAVCCGFCFWFLFWWFGCLVGFDVWLRLGTILPSWFGVGIVIVDVWLVFAIVGGSDRG